ncbi:hypothetical protein YC2023_103043 [Brassica napus]
MKKSPLEEIESLVSTRTTVKLIPTTAKLDDDETRAPESTAWTEEAWSRLGGDGGAARKKEFVVVRGEVRRAATERDWDTARELSGLGREFKGARCCGRCISNAAWNEALAGASD